MRGTIGVAAGALALVALVITARSTRDQPWSSEDELLALPRKTAANRSPELTKVRACCVFTTRQAL